MSHDSWCPKKREEEDEDVGCDIKMRCKIERSIATKVVTNVGDKSAFLFKVI